MEKKVFLNNRKRGISPVIATVLLIAMIVVIGLIVFVWFQNIIQEEGTKFGKNVNLVCGDVSFDTDYDSYSGTLSISNNGNVPIFGMKIKISGEGSHTTKDLKEISSSWPDLGLNQGGTFSEKISETSSAEEIKIIPVLMGISEGKNKIFICEEQYGQDIVI
jgi:flagellin-like protein